MEDTRLGENAVTVARSAVSGATVLSVAAVLLAWQVASLFFTPGIFPGLGRLAADLSVVLAGNGRHRLVDHVPVTLLRVVVGFAVATAVGTLFGTAMGTRRRAERYLLATTLVLLGVPAIVWAFVLVSWFGLTSLLVPVATITLVVVPYVTINVWEGIQDVDYRLVEMADAYEVGRVQRLTGVYLPQIGPYLFSTVRIAFAISWKIVLIAEMFGATHGVGFAINYYFTRDATGMVVAWALPIMMLVYALDRLLNRVERRFFDWRATDVATGGVGA